MASSNRAARRRNERDRAKGRGRAMPEVVVPKGGEFGVEIDCTDGGVVFTLLCGTTAVTTLWTHQDALEVAKMIDAAGNKDRGKAVEVVRQSGLVVPPAGMQL